MFRVENINTLMSLACFQSVSCMSNTSVRVASQVFVFLSFFSCVVGSALPRDPWTTLVTVLFFSQTRCDHRGSVRLQRLGGWVPVLLVPRRRRSRPHILVATRHPNQKTSTNMEEENVFRQQTLTTKMAHARRSKI